MFNDLITFGGCLEACTEYFMFEDVTFLRDFGPWKKGDKPNCLMITVDDGEPVVEEYDEDGQVLRSCKYQIVALPN